MKGGFFANALAVACLAISSRGVIGGATRELQLTPEEEDQFLPVIAVIDKGGSTPSAMDASYESFRDAYPDRPFCLLQVRPINDILVPPDMEREDNVILRLANRDYGMVSFQSDWFDLCNLYDPVTTNVALLLNVTDIQVMASLAFFVYRTSNVGLQILFAFPGNDGNWIEPLARDLDAFVEHTPTPSVSPSSRPNAIPSKAPSSSPSSQPSGIPSGKPSTTASNPPSSVPSNSPSLTPSSIASLTPSSSPSLMPSSSPSLMPSSTESNVPSAQPSIQPSSQPSMKTVTAFSIEGAFTRSWLASFNQETAKEVFASASQVITGDIPDATTKGERTLCGRTPTAVDDLWICSNTRALEGEAVSIAGPALVRSDVSGSFLPITGEISIDPSKIRSDIELKEVLNRQLQHVLGIGTLWGGPYGYGLATEVSDECIYDPQSKASLAYQELSGCSAGPPVESDCGEFSSGCFQEPSNSMTSKMIMASLEDMHYPVNYNMASRDEELDASCKCQRRGLRSQTAPSSPRPTGRRLSEAGRAKATKIGMKILRERQAQYLYTRPTFAEKPPLDMSLQVISTIFKEDGAFFSVVIRD